MGGRSFWAQAAVWLADKAAEGLWQAVFMTLLAGGSLGATFKGISDRPQWLIIGLPGIALFGFLLWYLRTSRRSPASPLAVDLEGDSARYEHYGLNSCRRVRIRNQSAETVRNVRAQLERCEQQNAGFYPVQLQRMHNAPHPFDLDPGAHAYVDLVYLHRGAAEYLLAYDMSTLPPGTPSAVPVQPLDLLVSVTGTDIPKIECGFAVSVDRAGLLHVIQH